MDYGIIGGADGPTAIFVATRFGWNPINWFGVITVVLILIPNMIYAVKCGGAKNLCKNKLLNILEQVGRYGSMLFLCVYVGLEDGFGFGSVFAFLCYLFGNICLIFAYWCTWAAYFKVSGIWAKKDKEKEKADGVTAVFAVGKEQVEKVKGLKYTLAILPAMLFFVDGMTLENIPLIICAILFAIGHIGVTRENIRLSISGEEGVR